MIRDIIFRIRHIFYKIKAYFLKLSIFKRVFLIYIIFAIIFSLCNTVFGYELKITDWRVWSWNSVQSGNICDLADVVEKLKARDEYASGNYYYFAFHDQNDNLKAGVLVPKSLCDVDTVIFVGNYLRKAY